MSDPRPLGPPCERPRERTWNDTVWSRYALAAAAVAVCALLTYLLRLGVSSPSARITFAFFYLAVFVSVWFGGRGPALFSIALSLVVADLFFLPGDFFAPDLSGVIPSAFFIGISLMAVFLLERSRRAERVAREARGSLETTLRSIGDAVISTDAAGRVVFMNPVAERLTGWTLADASGRPLSEVFRIVNEQTRAAVESPVERVLREGGIVGLANHTVLLARDGREVPIDDSGAPIRDAQGHITGVVLVFHDITERRSAEAERSLLAAIVESSQDAVIGKQLDGTITSWNETAERLYGYTAEEAVGRHISLVVPEDHNDELEEIMSRLRHGERIEHVETVRVTKSGERKDVSLTISPIRDASGRWVGASTVARDITDYKHTAEERARLLLTVERERLRLRRLVADVPGVVWEAWGAPDESGQRINFVSDHVEKMLGYTVEEWLQTPNFWLTIVHPEDRERAAAEALAIFESGTVGVSRFRWMRKDGHAVAVEAQSSVILDERGEPLGMRGVTMDITERKAAEERLRFIAEASRVLASSLDYQLTLERLARLSVSALADYCLIDLADGDGSVRRVAVSHADAARQPLVERLREYTPDDLNAAGTPSVLRTGEPLAVNEVDDEVIASIARDDEHARVLRELGLRSFLAVPLVSRERTIGALTFASTRARREYTAEDISYAQEIAARAALAIENARLYKRAREVNQAKDEFLATLSHELRTPLTPILGWTHMIRSGRLNETEIGRGVRVIEKNSQSLSRLINDLLDMSSILSGKMRIEREPVELSSVVREAIETVRPQADARSVALEASLGGAEAIVSGDRTRLVQVFWNLLNNAVKFSPEGGRVRVSLNTDSGRAASVSVEDDGQGITSEFIPHVFERFRQADMGTTRHHGGLGLGLAIVRHLAELHGGTVEAESAGTGQGATFILRLPLKSPPRAEERAEPRVSTPGASANEPRSDSLAGRRVLLVEDESDTREMLRAVLEAEGASVNAVGSAAEAWDALEEAGCDIIISDIGMPEEDGYSFVARVRERDERAGTHTPAVALTAYTREEDRALSLASGFDAHVPKPVEPPELLNVIAHLTGPDS